MEIDHRSLVIWGRLFLFDLSCNPNLLLASIYAFCHELPLLSLRYFVCRLRKGGLGSLIRGCRLFQVFRAFYRFLGSWKLIMLFLHHFYLTFQSSQSRTWSHFCCNISNKEFYCIFSQIIGLLLFCSTSCLFESYSFSYDLFLSRYSICHFIAIVRSLCLKLLISGSYICSIRKLCCCIFYCFLIFSTIWWTHLLRILFSGFLMLRVKMLLLLIFCWI